MKRAALYGRFSSDQQNEKSVDDQIALLRKFAADHHLRVVTTFEDRAISGSSIHIRPGIQALLAAAAERQFDVVLTESTSRIGRDQEDRARIRKILAFHDITLMTPADGVVTHLVDGVRSIVDEQYLRDLRSATRRGMQAAVAAGRNPGGRCYGYRSTPGKAGGLMIEPAEAAIVIRIFERYVAGQSPRQIAHDLNSQSVPPPRAGARWNASTINGNSKRGSGILHNTLYMGEIRWNRVRMMRDPATGKRVSRPNEPKDYHRASVPHLKIVSRELFVAAQERKAQRRIAGPARARGPKRLLSALLRCGMCGGGMSVCSTQSERPRISCTTRRESGCCDHARHYDLAEIEKRVVDGLRSQFGSREAIKLFIDTYNEERKRSSAHSVRRLADIERQLGEVAREIKRLVKAIAKGADFEEIRDEMLAAQTRKAELTTALTEVDKPPTVIKLHGPAIDRYVAAIESLSMFARGRLVAGDDEVAAAIRSLIEEVIVVPAPPGRGPKLRVTGGVMALLPPEAQRALAAETSAGSAGSGGGI